METSGIVTNCDLRSQSIELLRRRVWHSPCGHQLSLANRVHDFHARKRTPRRPKRLEAQPRTCDPFHRPMVLVELSEGIAPSAGLRNRAGRRVGGQRVTSVGTFPTASPRTDRESFDLSQLASGHFECQGHSGSSHLAYRMAPHTLTTCRALPCTRLSRVPWWV